VPHRRPGKAFLQTLHVPVGDLSRASLACRLKTAPQEVNRLTNVQHTSRIDGIASALKALGKRLDMRTV
jgi:antitoxin HicB